MPLASTFGVAAARAFGFLSNVLRIDEFFEYVTLLLPGNGTNGAQNNTFLDSSTNAFSITRNGNTTQGTFSPFSQTGWSNYFDGSGDFLTLASNTALDMGTGNFTVEMWVYSTDASVDTQNRRFFATEANGSGSIQLGHVTTTTGVAQYCDNGSLGALITGTTNILNQWAHIAAVRSGTTVTLYVNGVSEGTATDSGNKTSTTFTIGKYPGASGHLKGYLASLRVVKGTAVYTGNFTPSTIPLTAISGTSLLTCQSNRFVDNSTNAFAITRNGDVSVQAFSPFNPTSAWSAATNGGSGYFDGSGDYLSVADSTALDLNTTFTVEGWFYQPTAGNGAIFARGGGAASWSTVDGHEYHALVFSSLFYWQFNSGGSVVSITATAPAAGAWHHFAVGYNGTTTRVWLNGASIGTSTSGYTLPASRGITRVGFAASSEMPFTGYISNLRVVKGTDVYGVGNTSITVPTAPLTAITNTSLLLNFTNGAIYDATSKNDLETVGNAQISTTQSKWGGSSMYFDGSGDWLSVPDNSAFDFGSGDFTIEMWVYPTAVGQSSLTLLYAKPNGSGYSGISVGQTVGGYGAVIYASSNGTSWNLASGASAGTMTANTWNHVAVSRSGTNIYAFVGGVLGSTTAVSTTALITTTTAVSLGSSAGTANTFLTGYLQDLRITKGVARYTSNFTPPTAPFPVR